LTVTHLSKQFPAPGGIRGSVRAVNDVSFTLRKGETLGLVGESGSGKTTVGRCVMRLAEPSSGHILFHGEEITRMKARPLRNLRARIQIVFQEPYDSFDPRLTIADAIAEPLKLIKRLGWVERLKRVVEVARLTYIEEHDLRKYPHELSAGQLQRAGIARAMVTEPELIVLDEPTSLLDASVRADIIDLLTDLQRRTGVSYIIISHDLTAVEHISHKVAVMYLGQIVESGTARQVFEAALHPYTRSLLSAVLVPDPRAEQVRAPLVGEIPSPIDLPSGCFLHQRCPIAIDACSRMEPELVGVGGGHFVRCIRIAPLPSQVLHDEPKIMWSGPREFGFASDESVGAASSSDRQH
jgi:oligopeptide/dipeptide ABC transporter ATP-binding protein